MKQSSPQGSEQFWDLIESFFETARAFGETYETYETKVLQYAEERGVDRRFLRLSGEEVSGLLDFKKLESLRNGALQRLKTIAHTIFRAEDTTDPFDRYVSQIFHELSILKEEQYKVSKFATDYAKEADSAAYESILDEVHEAFPRQVHAIYELLKKAQARLESLLPHFAHDKVTIRSLYLFGDETFRGFYPNGTEDVLKLMYPTGGALEGYVTVARSFLESGFREYAIEALEKGLCSSEAASEETAESARLEAVAAAPDASAAVPSKAEAPAVAQLRREAEELLRNLKESTARAGFRPPVGSTAKRGGAGTRVAEPR